MVLLMGFISQLVERLVRKSDCTMDFFYVLCLLKLLWNFNWTHLRSHVCLHPLGALATSVALFLALPLSQDDHFPHPQFCPYLTNPIELFHIL